MDKRLFFKMKAIICAMIIMSLISGSTTFNAKAAEASKVSLNAPITVDDKNTVSGKKVTWDCIWYGSYPQNKSSKYEPVKWRVLSVEGNQALLLSDAILSKHYYYEGIYNDAMLRYEGTATLLWSNSDIKEYLGEMYKRMFSPSERVAIEYSNVKTLSYNEDTGEYEEDVTKDDLFLLTEEDMNNPAYGFSDACPEARYGKETNIIQGSDYTYGFRPISESNTYYLRTLGVKSSDTYGPYPVEKYLTDVPVSSVNANGEIIKSNGLHLTGVRTAMRIDLSKAEYEYAGTVSSDGTMDEVPYPSTVTTEEGDAIGTIFKVTNYAGHTVYYRKTGEDTVEFYVCETNKTKIAIPDEIRLGNQYSKNYKVTSIASNVFKNDKSIKKITIGTNVKTIGKKAFYGCKNLKTIIIQTQKLKSADIGKKAFKGIFAKAKITVPKGKKKSYTKLLRAKGVSKKASIEATYTKPVVFIISKSENYTVYYKKTGKNTVEYMKCATNKSKIVVPKKIKVDGKTYKVTSIGAKAVAGNNKIKQVTISSNVKAIGRKAFYKCKKLETIVIKAKKLKAKNVGAKAFAGISAMATIKVPK